MKIFVSDGVLISLFMRFSLFERKSERVHEVDDFLEVLSEVTVRDEELVE